MSVEYEFYSRKMTKSWLVSQDQRLQLMLYVINLINQFDLDNNIQNYFLMKQAQSPLRSGVFKLKYCDYSPGPGDTRSNGQTNDVEKQ